MFSRSHDRKRASGPKGRRLKYEPLEPRIVLSIDSPLSGDDSSAPAAVAEPVPAAALSIADWVQSLHFTQFNQLLPEHVSYLTTQQVASIPEVFWFSQIPAQSRAVLSQTHVQALKVSTVQLLFLTPQQVSWLTAAQIRTLQVADFKYLSAAQTPLLTVGQIASIPDPGPFAEWTPAARAALTPPQIQALNVAKVWLTQLTPQQVSWLTVAQIQSLRLHDFKYLSAAQTPSLTLAQIAAIPNPGPFAEWTPAARAALTQSQIQALDVAKVWLTQLTPQQVGWLTAAQIRTLQVADFKYLSAAQTPLLTVGQIASIPDPGPFSEWTPAARAALTQSQIQALYVGSVRLTFLTAQQIGWLTAAQIRTLQVADFKYLNAAQTPSLLPAQIALISDPGPFAEWTPAARAALIPTQIQALQVGVVRLDLLSPQQVGWLTAAQISTLQMADFRYLSAAQTPSLTLAQIAAIPNPGPFAEWTPAARAALTINQVRALNVAAVWITQLTPQQVGWLTVAQIQSLRLHDFKYLSAAQTPLLTLGQIAAIPDPGPFSEWTPAARAALTQSQIQALYVGSVRLTFLTAQQIGWLTAAQIRTLQVADFKYLNAAQTPSLLPAQIALISDPGPFAEWTPAARAALIPTQIQALQVGVVRLDLLSPQQVGWLTAAQISTLQMADFRYLSAAQTPSLTLAQIAAIPNPGPFAEWTPAARAALTINQVRALNVAAVWITQLTPQQVGWLTVAQIQSLRLHDFKYLSAAQTPLLTLGQIAAIPDPGPFSEWTPAARAALTINQVRALNVATVWITQLTPQQVSWLTNGQIQALRWEDISHLAPEQIPVVTPAQFSKIPEAGFLRELSDEVKSRIGRAQLLALPTSVLAEHVSSLLPPAGYTPTVDIPVGPDGLPNNHLAHEEAQRVFNLVPDAAATHVSVASGNWTDPNVWKDRIVPAAGARVVIAAGTVVRYERYMTPSTAINTLRIDGTLTFATGADTQLYADTIVVYTTGKLHIGTAAAPIADHVTASIIITDNGPINRQWDPYMLSRGLISQGEVRMYGKSVTPYAALRFAPVKGDNVLWFEQVPVNWKVGDKILLMGAMQHVAGYETEELTIRAVNGSFVTVDPLRYDRLPPAGFDLSIYAANVTRNIQFKSAKDSPPSQSPHLMFMHNPNVKIENISVVGFGRTDKSIPVNDPVVVNGALQPGTGLNPRARYAVHFHHTGVNPAYAPAEIRGSFVSDSPGWGYVNHSSNVMMENNVAYNVVGSAFVGEDGNEIGVMRGNFSLVTTGSGGEIQDRQYNHDFGHGGHGYWLQGPGIAVVDNISAGNAAGAFVYFTTSSKAMFDAANLDDPLLAAGRKAIPVNSVPLKAFSGNVAATSKTGLEIWHHMTLMPTGESYIQDFTAWNIRSNGIQLHYVGQTTFRNPTLVGSMTSFEYTGIFANHASHDLTYENVHIEGFEVGILAPGRRTNTIYRGAINAVEGIRIETANDSIRVVNIIGPVDFKTPTVAQLAGRTPFRVSLAASTDFTFRGLAAMLSTDSIHMFSAIGKPTALYFPEQAASYVPFTVASALGLVPNEYLGLTNAQLRTRFGVSLGGEFPPSDAISFSGYRALIDLSPGP